MDTNCQPKGKQFPKNHYALCAVDGVMWPDGFEVFDGKVFFLLFDSKSKWEFFNSLTAVGLNR
jgi:hypothetical protein